MLRNGTPFKDSVLPGSIEEVRVKLAEVTRATAGAVITHLGEDGKTSMCFDTIDRGRR